MKSIVSYPLLSAEISMKTTPTAAFLFPLGVENSVINFLSRPMGKEARIPCHPGAVFFHVQGFMLPGNIKRALRKKKIIIGKQCDSNWKFTRKKRNARKLLRC